MRVKQGEISSPDRLRQLKGVVKHARPGMLVEFGCGAGEVLQSLAEGFPTSLIVGVDVSERVLRAVRERHLENVLPVCSDATQKIFLNNSLDTALFVASLHEIYSFLGKSYVMSSLRIAFDVLKEGGVLIISDFLKPQPRWVRMGFRNKETWERFRRFAKEFEPRKVKFEKLGRAVKLDIADALEFIVKYRSPDEEDWKIEMKEVHFFFTMGDYKRALREVGFRIIALENWPRSEERWVETRRDIEFESESAYRFILVAAEKQQAVS
jgi:SAM-dependent methyltransferase